jgi:hypothetical protein
MCDGMLMIYKICSMEILVCHLVFVAFWSLECMGYCTCKLYY